MKNQDNNSEIVEHVMRLGQCDTIDSAYDIATGEYNRKTRQKNKIMYDEKIKFKKYIATITAIPDICLVRTAPHNSWCRVTCLSSLKDQVENNIDNVHAYIDSVKKYVVFQ